MEKIYFLRSRVLLCPQIKRIDHAYEQITSYVELRPPDTYLVKSFHRMRVSTPKASGQPLFFLFETELKPPALANNLMRMTDQLALILPMDAALLGCSVDFVNDDSTWTPGALPPVRVCFRIITPPTPPSTAKHPSVCRSILACGLWLAHLTVKDIVDFSRA